MRENFERALKHVFGSEGGLSMDRNDPGNWTGGKVGRGVLKGTKYGIAANTYPNEDIRNLTRERAALLYKRDYWDKVRADDLPPGVDLIAFDMAVNTGLRRAAIMLQRAAGVEADGKIGPKTIAAINAKTPKVFIYSLTVERLRFYQNLSSWTRYGRGWKRRVLSVEKEAQKWAAERQLGVTRTAMAETENPASVAPEATQTAFYSEPETNTMLGTKSPLASIGIMGPLLGMIASLISTYLKVEVSQEQLATAFDLFVTLGPAIFGCVAGIIGRWRATKQIEVRGP